MSDFDPGRKLYTDAAAARMWRNRQDGPVVLTNGIFDLLHPGHVDLLRQARAYGSALIVAVNSDASTRRLKGPTRPIRTLADRMYVLGALECVDAVVSFEPDTPRDLIIQIRPDVLVKGGDYTIDQIAGAREVYGWGGSVKIISLTANQSTTAIVQTIRGTPAGREG